MAAKNVGPRGGTSGGTSGGASGSGSEAETDSGSARRLLRVLLSFTADEPFATAEQLARRTGLPLSSTYRYLATLREAALVEERGRQGFIVGPSALRLALAARAANPLDRMAQPYMRRLVAEALETAVLVRQIGDLALCVECIAPPRTIRAVIDVGASRSLARGAGAKVLLAGMSDANRMQVLQRCAVADGLAPAWVEAMVAESRSIASRGWAAALDEVFPETFTVAAPVRVFGAVEAALVIMAPSHRISSVVADNLRKQVVEAAAAISAEFPGEQEAPSRIS